METEITNKGIPRLHKWLVLILGFMLLFSVLAIGRLVGIPGWGDISYLRLVILALLIAVVTVPVHEAIHGLLFKIFGGKVKFGHSWRGGGILGPSFWTSSLGTLFTRNQMILIGLGPQILSLLVLGLLAVTNSPPLVGNALLNLAALNSAGGCMDIYIALRLSKYPSTCKVEDTKTGVKIYGN